MPGPDLPRLDRVVVALWRTGAVQPAIELASHALVRSDPAQAVLRDQLDRLRDGRGLDDALAAPPLDLHLVIAMVERHHLHEAACLLRALSLREAGAERLGALLEQVIAPFPEGTDPSFNAVLDLVRAGQAPSALRALEEVLQETVAAPDWLSDRCHALSALVGGDWWRGPASVEQVTADTVLERLRKRDLQGALEAAEQADAVELASVLRRLLEETGRTFSEAAKGGSNDIGTAPVEGLGLAAFHLNMGMLSHAEAVYRRLIRRDGDDDHTRALLADVIALRRALGEDAKPIPPRKRLSVHWLSKKGPKQSAEWGAGAARWKELEPLDESTEVLDASQEAELLLQVGKAEQALGMYRILVIRHPKKALYRCRIEEIQSLIAQRLTSVAAEVTAKYDLTELGATAVPTNPRLSPEILLGHPRFGEDDDATTELDAVPREAQRKKPR